MQEYNKYFSISDWIGKKITEEEFQCLMAEKRVWITKCRMIGVVARKAMPHIDPIEFDEEERSYCGHIVTFKPEDLQEADSIADKRGWNEEVEGVLYGVIPFNHEMINPTEIKNQN